MIEKNTFIVLKVSFLTRYVRLPRHFITHADDKPLPHSRMCQ
jgi:hypothetical protein